MLKGGYSSLRDRQPSACRFESKYCQRITLGLLEFESAGLVSAESESAESESAELGFAGLARLAVEQHLYELSYGYARFALEEIRKWLEDGLDHELTAIRALASHVSPLEIVLVETPFTQFGAILLFTVLSG